VPTDGEAVVRRLFEALNDGTAASESTVSDLAGAVFAPEAVYREDERWPGAGVYRGREEIAACWSRYLEVFEDPVLELQRVEPLGGERYIADVVFTSHVGEMPVGHTWHYVVTVRDGLVQSLDAHLDRTGIR
jgi:ketosteroid isomerase-like protein